MRGKNHRLWVFLFTALLLVLAFAGYKYVTRVQQVTAPVNSNDPTTGPTAENPLPEEAVEEVEEISVGVVDLELLRHSHPKVNTIDQLEDQIRGYRQELSRQQSELMTNQKQVENQYVSLNSQLEEQVKEIQNKYQQKIDAKVAELQTGLNSFEEKTWKEAMAESERKHADVIDLGKEAIERQQVKLAERLEEYKKELAAQYSPEILNLRLKLQMVQLTEAERKKYTDRLEKIQVEQDEKMQEMQKSLEEDMTKFIEAKQLELDEELKVYQEQAKDNVESMLRAKQAELDETLQAYIAQAEADMQEEIKAKQTRLEEQTRNGLTRAQQQIETELQKNEKLLMGKIADAEKKQEGILQQIDEDIKAIIAELAQEKNLDVVLTEIRVNVQALDLTDQALKKLKQ